MLNADLSSVNNLDSAHQSKMSGVSSISPCLNSSRNWVVFLLNFFSNSNNRRSVLLMANDIRFSSSLSPFERYASTRLTSSILERTFITVAIILLPIIKMVILF